MFVTVGISPSPRLVLLNDLVGLGRACSNTLGRHLSHP